MDSSLEGTERHCAACRKPIPPESIKICGKCRRRPYCSKECQEKDWKPKRNGTQAEFQGHKSWCGLTYGEEDLDWVITDVAEKGLGIVSRRVIPAGYRIMVEREQRGENLECGVRSCATMLNHNCDPNAYKSIDTTYGVFIILAKKDIQPGEEICVNYTTYTDTYYRGTYDMFGLTPADKVIESFEDCRNVLAQRYGIICNEECFCHSPQEVDDMINYEKKLFQLLTGDKVDYTDAVTLCLDMRVVELLLEKERQVGGPFARLCVLEDGFKIAAQRKSTLERGMLWLQEAYEISQSLSHPKLLETKKLKGWLEEPRTFDKFMAAERLKIPKSVASKVSSLSMQDLLAGVTV